jgi:type IV secretory pathway VirD2 relaxase
MERLDGAHDKRAVRTGPAEERHVVARLGHDVRSADELSCPSSSNAGRERALEQRDDLAFRYLESPTGRVDAEDAAPQARGPRIPLGPALLMAAKQVRL